MSREIKLIIFLAILFMTKSNLMLSQTYKLPFVNGQTYTCTQGNNSAYSHTGIAAYAFDFNLQIGDYIVASRSGVVSHIVESYPDYNNPTDCNEVNRLVVDHGDGSSALYLHITYDGALVEVGDEVNAGEIIAISGNTGCSTGAHLHFAVMESEPSEWYNQSIPISFCDVNDNGIPVTGGEYTAEGCTNLELQSSLTDYYPNPIISDAYFEVEFEVKNNSDTDWDGCFFLALHDSVGSFVDDLDNNEIFIPAGNSVNVLLINYAMDYLPGDYQLHLKYQDNCFGTQYPLVPEGNNINPIDIVISEELNNTDLIYSAYELSDSVFADGNGNGMMEAGETIALKIRLQNEGNGTADDVNAIVSCSDPDINFLDDELHFSTISSNDTSWSSDIVLFQVEEGAVEKDVEFELNITSNSGNFIDDFSLHLYGQGIGEPMLIYSDHMIHDGAIYGSGNGNFQLDNGESIVFQYEIENAGTAIATNVYANLSCSDSDISIIDGSANFPNLSPGDYQFGTDDFGFEISSDCPNKDVQITIDVFSDQGNWSEVIVLNVNSPIDPIESLAYSDHWLHDGFLGGDGNSNGIAESGEEIYFQLEIINNGTGLMESVSVSLYCADPDILVANNQVYYPDMSPGDYSWGADGFGFNIADDCIEKDVTLYFTIHATQGSWAYNHNLHIDGLEPPADDFYLSDLSLNNSLLYPEELLSFTLKNCYQGISVQDLNSEIAYYISEDEFLDSYDVQIGTDVSGLSVNNLCDYESHSYLLPSDIVPGSYYLIAVTDYLNVFDEDNEVNNILVQQFEVLDPLQVSLMINIPGAGILSGEGEYLSGDLVSISAQSNPGFQFLYWEENSIPISYASNFSFEINQNRNFVAVFDALSSINQKHQQVLVLYPNPASRFLSITVLDDKQKSPLSLEIFNMQGKCVSKMLLQENDTKIDLRNLADGTYQFVFYRNESVFHEELIIIKK